MKEYTLYATMGAGFESVVAKELNNLGYETTTENGRVFFKGTQKDIVRTNLWLRSADRVKILLKEFKATSFDQLYDEVYSYDWAELLPVDAQFPVKGRSVRSKLHSEPDVQSIVKKAIVPGKFGFFVQILRSRKQRIKKMKYALDNLQTLDI